MKLPRPKHCEVFSTFAPLYNVSIYLVLGRDPNAISRARPKFNKILGPSCFPDWDGTGAMCCWDHGAEVGMFFHRKSLAPGTVAHEILHATARVMQRAGVSFDPDNMEAFTYLCEWMTNWVYVQIGDAIKV